ncbi:hypothetical protein THAOC_07328 [Thalassiosira oceanica]|uniref:Uncharacterized protein n=1 Tax=Thalassiosira oceanica TaxID=159749 RepID=K0T281_THAOC|nr:hypothetical protein THAOC_07328 [Thalassiosira oceanica]|eukprot:EJK71254.1 hypothetical protein THAOC_07328 [Thalassiosira oceanica]
MKTSRATFQSVAGASLFTAMATGMTTERQANEGIQRRNQDPAALLLLEHVNDLRTNTTAELISKYGWDSHRYRAKNFTNSTVNPNGFFIQESGSMESGIIAESNLDEVEVDVWREDIDCDDCIHCDEGFAFVDGVRTVTTCADACAESGGTCCEGDYTRFESEELDLILEGGPCSGFTGRVKPNGACSGDFACLNASIDYVSESCTGFGACTLAGASQIYGGGGRMLEGGSGGYVHKIINGSCVGVGLSSSSSSSACFGLGFAGGNVNLIDDSCRGDGDILDPNSPGREFHTPTVRADSSHLT